MPHGLYTLIYLLFEGLAARRDAQIRFLQAENRILRSRLPGNRVIVTPEERAGLLKIGAELGHKVRGLVTLVQFPTYRRWVREQQIGKPVGRVGRPRKIAQAVRDAIVRFARENAGWGYMRIVGELLKLHESVSAPSVKRILEEEGIYPDPDKQKTRDDRSSWDLFIDLHLNTLVACDFFSKTIYTALGRRTAYCLMFIHLGTRKVFVSPATYQPDADWTKQQARNMLMWLEEQGLEATHLIRDGDGKFGPSGGGFDLVLKGAGVRVRKTFPASPWLNGYAECWIGSLKRESLKRFVCFGLKHLDHIVQAYARFHNTHRPHQGKDNRVLSIGELEQSAETEPSPPLGKITCEPQLGGLLKHYRRAA